jgi:hypothetical protein
MRPTEDGLKLYAKNTWPTKNLCQNFFRTLRHSKANAASVSFLALVRGVTPQATLAE